MRTGLVDRQSMKIVLLGGGTIARLVLERVAAGALPGVTIAGVMGRQPGSRAADLARQFAVPYLLGVEAVRALRPDAVLEAASHEAVRQHLVALLRGGVSVVVLSAGALADRALHEAAEAAAQAGGARLLVPSGGIGGLDALNAACIAGVDEVSIQVAKPPAAWRGIPYVERLGLRFESLDGPQVLFEGSAREGVPHFPQNVNIAAVLSLAGIGMDRTQLRVVADPALKMNTHTIRVAGRTGRFTIVLENVPTPENPKTSWLACCSAVDALRALAAPARYGS
jgi:aspartate dehydrogenase